MCEHKGVKEQSGADTLFSDSPYCKSEATGVLRLKKTTAKQLLQVWVVPAQGPLRHMLIQQLL